MATRSLLAALTLYMIVSSSKLTNCEDYITTFGFSDSSLLVNAISGDTPGWIQIQSQSPVKLKSHTIETFFIGQSLGITAEIENKSVLINTSDAFVDIYSLNFNDLFHPISISALGTKYVVSSCLTSNSKSVLVIASHNLKAEINILFRVKGNVTFNGRTYSNGESLTLHLSTYQTCTIRSKYDLSGTIISSSETVAVFSGIVFGNMGYIGAYDQLLPVKLYSKEYVVAVDDHRHLYQLQVITDESDTHITFNNGSTFSFGDDHIYRGTVQRNESLSFITTRPVLTTLCRVGAESTDSGFVTVPALMYSRKRSGIIMHQGATAKILKENNRDSVLVSNSTMTSVHINWQDIPESRFTVGTFTSERSPTLYITSEYGFTLLVYSYCCLYNGGYGFQNNISKHTEVSTAFPGEQTTSMSTANMNSIDINPESTSPGDQTTSLSTAVIKSSDINPASTPVTTFAIVGIVCGCVLVFAAIVAKVPLIYNRKRISTKKTRNKEKEEPPIEVIYDISVDESSFDDGSFDDVSVVNIDHHYANCDMENNTQHVPDENFYINTGIAPIYENMLE